MKALFAKITVLNTCGLAVLAFLWYIGLVDKARENDPTYLVETCGVYFLWATAMLYWHGRKFFKESFLPYRVKYLKKTRHLDDIPETLVYIGLLGTLLGVVSGLGDFETVGKAAMFEGIKTAGWTTLSSIVFAVWFTQILRVFRTSTEV